MTLIFQALVMLCALGAVALSSSTTTWGSRIFLAAGFALTAAWVRPERIPDTVTIAVAAACAAYLAIAARRKWLVWFAASCGGFLAGVFSVLIETMGAIRPLALAVSAGLAFAPAYLAAVSPRFAPQRIREEALVLVLVLGLSIAATPSILAGWTSALSLNIGAPSSAERAFPVWIILSGVATLGLGGVYSLWRRN